MSPPEARRTVNRAAGLGRACGRAAGTLVLALVVVPPLAIGTVHAMPRAIVFSSCAAALGLLVVERLLLGKRIRVTVPLVALAVAFLATLLQLAPLPPAVVAHVSPAAHETLSMTLGDYGWHALSLDPAGTGAELAKIGAYLAFFAVATHVCSKSHRRRQLLLAVSATAA